MRQWLKNLLCRLRGHGPLVWRCNIYGDNIIFCAGNRSIWTCSTCGWTLYKPDPVDEQEGA